MWQISPLLREKHRDWHPSAYTLINHVSGLHSDEFVRIVPTRNVQALKEWLEEYKKQRKVLRASYRARKLKRVSPYSPEQVKKATRNKRKLLGFSETLLKQTRCYAIAYSSKS